jgi:ribosomal protein S6--L-glutamate ligase
VKLLEGTQGIGVVLAETRNAAQSVIEAFRGLKQNILVQQYVSESNGSDIRCFIIGNRVAGAMIRTSSDGDFRSNLHRGESETGSAHLGGGGDRDPRSADHRPIRGRGISSGRKKGPW